MKQVLENLRTGQIEVAEVPCPRVRPGHLLVQTSRTLVSPGTERMLVEFGQAGLIAKARAQPEKVRQVLDKIRSDGLLPTLEAVFSRLDEPLPLGYCNVGRVVEVGPGVSGLTPGQRVVSNGPHAEMVLVPTTLAARVPDSVSDEAAAFAVAGSIALQGIRLLSPTFGECFAVVGLGMLGLLAVQMLRASGCRVLGVDVDATRCELARSLGCESTCVAGAADPVPAGQAFSRGRGVDGVLIAASAKTDEIIHQAAQMCRKRGRIVLVGVVGLNLKRSDFYEKELSFQVSCSYGPGRYDPLYEEQAQDYPLPYVRWTVARNFEAVLDAMAGGTVDVAPLISHRIPQVEAPRAYELVLGDPRALGVILTYPEQPAPLERVVRVAPAVRGRSVGVTPAVAVIGAGRFARSTLLPAIRRTGARLVAVASAGGVSSLHAARRFGAEQALSDYRSIWEMPEVNVVFIATRHGSHASLAAEALRAGKHVFVEKPLAIDEEGLEQVRQAHAQRPDLQLMVGFNRRFAPHAQAARRLVAGRSQPLAMSILVNAGAVPPTDWTQDEESGGGRIIGEGCHFIDLLRFLAGCPIVRVQALMFGPQAADVREDKMSITLGLADGSIGTVHYWANGPRSFPKERVEVFSEGRVLMIDNWRRLRSWHWPGAPALRMRQDKGHAAEVAAFLERVRSGGEALIPFDELEEVTLASFAAVRAARQAITIELQRSP